MTQLIVVLDIDDASRFVTTFHACREAGVTFFKINARALLLPWGNGRDAVGYVCGYDCDVRQNISEALVGRPAHNKGKPSPLRGIPTGRPNSPEHREKMLRGLLAAIVGKPKSESQRLKMSESARNVWAKRKAVTVV